MRETLPPLGALRAFALVAETGSLTAAAARMNVTQPAVSRRLRELEAVLGVALVHRGANALRVTEIGARYAAAIEEGFARIRDATEALRRAPAAPLRVRAYTTWAHHWLIPRLAEFQARNAGLDVEVVTSTAPVDFAREAVDAAIRIAPSDAPPAPGAVQLQPVLVAPFVPGGRGRSGQQRGSLAGLRLLGSRVRPNDWAIWFAAQGKAMPAVPLLFESTTLAIRAAMEGLGAVICSPAFVEPELRRRRLLRLTSNAVLTGDHYWLLLPAGTPRPQALAFKEWLLERIVAEAREANVTAIVGQGTRTQRHNAAVSRGSRMSRKSPPVRNARVR